MYLAARARPPILAISATVIAACPYWDGRAKKVPSTLGAVEAKAEGTLTGVEAQSAEYAAGLPDNLPAHRRATCS